MSECYVCGKSGQKVALFRVSPIGVTPGEWRCRRCVTPAQWKLIDPVSVQIVTAIERSRKPKPWRPKKGEQ